MQSNDTRVSLFAGVLLGASAAVLYFYFCEEKFKNRHSPRINADASSSNTSHISSSSYPAEIKQELYSRSISFFTEEKFATLQSSFIVVVGLGGVGSHAANMLARTGITKLRLIDFDQVSLSSLNRNALACLEDVGLPKVQAIKQRILQVIPWCNIEAINEMFRANNAEKLLADSPDYVLDCIDDISTKAALIAFCTERGIKVITAMGAGGKADPTRLRIGTLKDCVRDPLAAKIKWKLQKAHAIAPEHVMTIYSSEKPICELLPLSDEQKEVHTQCPHQSDCSSASTTDTLYPHAHTGHLNICAYACSLPPSGMGAHHSN